MSRVSSGEKIKEWTSRVRRFEQSHQTVARFCLAEGVSQPSFYSWKKKLREVTDQVTPASSLVPGGSMFQAVQVTSILPRPTRQETVIRLGRDVEIELGNDLSVVESIVKQLLATTNQPGVQNADAPPTEVESC